MACVSVLIVTRPRQVLHPPLSLGPLFWSSARFHLITVFDQLRKAPTISVLASHIRFVEKLGDQLPADISVK